MNGSENTASPIFSTGWTHFATRTSGTTGRPKEISHSREDLLAVAKVQAEALGMNASSHCLLSLSNDHIAGVMIALRAQVSGATLHTEPNEHITHISMVPTQLYRLIRAPKAFPNLQALLIGGAPMSPHLFHEAMDANLPLYTSYGMTETAGMATLRPPSCKTLHAGWPLRDVELKIKEGEIHLKRRGKWIATRDLGHIDKAGALHITGRKDRQFISGGKNIQPEEIERALLSIQGVSRAHVTPVEDEEWGMRPHATVESSRSPEELRERLEELIDRYKVPDKIVLRSSGMGIEV